MGDVKLGSLQRDWEELGSIDPLWAILAHRGRQYGGWGLGEFMATGVRNVENLMARAESLGLPLRRDRALDFGCGIGRLTRPLAFWFGEAVGVDISAPMIEQAMLVNAGVRNCSFVHNTRPDLSILDDASFDLAYSHIVLMHLPNQAVAESYIRELIRVLRPGGLLVFQIPARIPLRRRLQPRRRVYAALRVIGLSSLPLYRRFGLHPIRTIDLPEDRAVHTIIGAGGQVLAIDRSHLDQLAIDDRTYYVGRGG
ncbi:MAG: class I SAM-dependent methyltransferase [Chloroflexota bacterium]|nr:class I SAM-dependent methyltransferase [Chloroflexota bacterium]